jgi:purine-binding chemotaxis protein CheW
VSEQDLRFAQQAAELRNAFDRSFAEAPRVGAEQSEDFLSIRAGPDAYAVRLAEVSGLFAGRKVTRLPNADAECLGIAGFRGTLVPVFDLRVLLGYPAADVPRWLVVTAAAPAALAFDTFDGHLRLPRAAIAREGGGEGARPHVREALRDGRLVLPVVDATSILNAIRKRIPHGVSQKEP